MQTIQSSSLAQDDLLLKHSERIQCQFVKKCKQLPSLSVSNTFLTELSDSHFVHKSLADLYSDTACKQILSGNALRFLSMQIIELLEREKCVYNRLLHFYETLAADPQLLTSQPTSSNANTNSEDATSKGQLLILVKLRTAMHHQMEYLKLLKYTRQVVVKVEQQCCRLNARLQQKKDSIQRLLSDSRTIPINVEDKNEILSSSADLLENSAFSIDF